MVDQLQAAGLKIAVASNRPNAAQRLNEAGLQADIIADHDLIGVDKGSPLWVDRPRQIFGVQPNELLYLGDSEYDMVSASHARVIYFNAGWAYPESNYGISLPEPRWFSLIVRECFRKPINWYWELTTTDQLGRTVMTRALIDGNGAGSATLKRKLLDFFKYGHGSRVGPMDFRFTCKSAYFQSGAEGSTSQPRHFANGQPAEARFWDFMRVEYKIPRILHWRLSSA